MKQTKENPVNNVVNNVESLNEILAKAKAEIGTNERKQIYKRDLFAGMTSKEQKKKRTQLRKMLDNFIGSAIAKRNDKNALNAIRKAWQEYANKVYINAECICDANKKTENVESVKTFLALMKNEK